MVAALWSNSNWDDDKDTRKNAIEELDEKHKEALRFIYGDEKASVSVSSDEIEEAEIDKSNPFFAAVDRGMAKLDTKFGHVSRSDDEQNKEYLRNLDQS
jgi:hypothetical protein